MEEYVPNFISITVFVNLRLLKTIYIMPMTNELGILLYI